MDKLYAKVIVNTGTRSLDRPFTYLLPDDLIQRTGIGYKVLVPFGQGNKYYEGFIIDYTDAIDEDIGKVKSVKDVIDDDIRLTEKQLELCLWMRQTYLSSYYEGIKCIVPSGSTYKSRVYFEIDKIGLKNRYKINTSGFSDMLDVVEAERLCQECGVKIATLKKHKLVKQIEQFYTSVKLQKKKIVNLATDKDFKREIMKMPKSAKKQVEALNILTKYESIEQQTLVKDYTISSSIIKSLEKKGLIYITFEDKYRNPIVLDEDMVIKDFVLNEEQNKAYQNIKGYIDNYSNERFLLHGITGSGKTQVYMRLVEDVLKQGRQVIVLVPEISLTTQILKRFTERFGEKVAVLHSKLSVGERYDQWIRIKKGELPIVIGARSAVFAPCDNVGLIVLDEEHEATYKSETNPKYITSNVARFIAKQHNAVLLLGSATPSVDSYHYAITNKYKLIELKNRFNNMQLPSVSIVDMREELNNGNRSMLSSTLYKKIQETLDNKKQVILFLNRRGYSNYISCRKCGYVLKCSKCDISLTFHQKNNYAKCHYCGLSERVPKECPECGSTYLKGLGIGTEKVEAYIKELFSEARVVRLDQDTAQGKNTMANIINDFEDGNYDIMIGTQMVAKGLDFPNVTLVGVLLADTTLNLPDYKANERTFQLLTQVAGRAGRHEDEGEVVIQTYEPESYAIRTASKHDYDKFFEKEISLRRAFDYPPFCNIVSITILGREEEDVIKSCYNIYNLINDLVFNVQKINDTEIMGPNPALVSKINNQYRWQILIKYDIKKHKQIKNIINYVCKAKVNELLRRNTSLLFDLKPFRI